MQSSRAPSAACCAGSHCPFLPCEPPLVLTLPFSPCLYVGLSAPPHSPHIVWGSPQVPWIVLPRSRSWRRVGESREPSCNNSWCDAGSCSWEGVCMPQLSASCKLDSPGLCHGYQVIARDMGDIFKSWLQIRKIRDVNISSHNQSVLTTRLYVILGCVHFSLWFWLNSILELRNVSMWKFHPCSCKNLHFLMDMHFLMKTFCYISICCTKGIF